MPDNRRLESLITNDSDLNRENVVELQIELGALYTGNIDGKIGPLTTGAVLDYVERTNNPELLLRLNATLMELVRQDDHLRHNAVEIAAATNVLPKFTAQLIKSWEETPDSMNSAFLQSALNRGGHNCGAIDGRVGPKTRSAVSSFYEKHPQYFEQGNSKFNIKFNNAASQGNPLSPDELKAKYPVPEKYVDMRDDNGNLRVTDSIHVALARAAEITGIRHDFLFDLAYKESTFRPNPPQDKTSATGLYQITNRTGRDLVALHGHKPGLKDIDLDGAIANTSILREHLKDPTISAMLASYYCITNYNGLKNFFGRPPNQTEVYMAHFLGLEGSKRFLPACRNDPSGRAIDYVSSSSTESNRETFYHNDGSPKTVHEVYQHYVDILGTEPVMQDDKPISAAPERQVIPGFVAV